MGMLGSGLYVADGSGMEMEIEMGVEVEESARW